MSAKLEMILDNWVADPEKMKTAPQNVLEAVGDLPLIAPPYASARDEERNALILGAREMVRPTSTLQLLRSWMDNPEERIAAAWISQLDAVADIPTEGLTEPQRAVKAMARKELTRRARLTVHSGLTTSVDEDRARLGLPPAPVPASTEELLNELCSLSRLIVGCEGLADSARMSALCADVEDRPELAVALAKAETARKALIDATNEAREVAFRARSDVRDELLSRQPPRFSC